jgi:hypothetical protein
MGLLALAGGMKMVNPELTSGALRAAQLPDSRILVRTIGLVEVLVGVSGVVVGNSIAAFLAAALYAGFAWFVINALRQRLPISSCGCLGATETPPGLNHVVLNVGAVIVLVFAGLFPIGPWGGIDQLAPGAAAAFVGFTGVTIYVLYAILAVLSQRRAPAGAASLHLSLTRRG